MPVKNLFPKDPVRARRWAVHLAICKRHAWYREMLWARLKAAAPKERWKDFNSASYKKLLERAADHEIRVEKHMLFLLDWVFTFEPKKRRALLQLVTVDG